MNKYKLEKYADVIFHAIDNKYKNLNYSMVLSVVQSCMEKYGDIVHESELFKKLEFIESRENDINNQMIALLLIENIWIHNRSIEHPIRKMHQVVIGGEAHSIFRITESVQDFQGKIPTPVEEITPRLDEIESLIETTASSFRQTCLYSQAIFLTHVFVSIIRLHPFQDANGRCARMIIQ